MRRVYWKNSIQWSISGAAEQQKKLQKQFAYSSLLGVPNGPSTWMQVSFPTLKPT